MRYPPWIFLLVLAMVVAYLNYWMWDVSSLVLGLPANLLYHLVLSVALAPIMLIVVRRAWPRYLDED